jgi:hypothetical protein
MINLGVGTGLRGINRATLIIAVVVAALVLPGVALAGILVLHGPAGSVGSGTIDITLITKHGRPLKLTRFEFNNIPASCTGYPQTAATGTFPHTIWVSSKNNFYATAKVHAGQLTYTVSGHFTGTGKAAGRLRIKGSVPGCVSADTGRVHWSVTKT